MTSDSPRWFLGVVSVLPDWGTEFVREQIVNHLEDGRHQLVKAIIRCGTGESAQQRDVVAPRIQARTKGDEGHRVRLGTTHGGQQDVISQQGLDQDGDAQEKDKSMRHLCGYRLSRTLQSRFFSLLLRECRYRARYLLNREGRSSRDPAPWTYPRYARTRVPFVTNFFVHRRSEKPVPVAQRICILSLRIVSSQLTEMKNERTGLLTLQFAAPINRVVVVIVS